MVRRSVTPVDGSSVELLQGTDTDVLSEVDVSRNRCGPNVVPKTSKPTYLGGQAGHALPVGVVWCKLLCCTGLDGVDPGRNLELSGSLQESGVSIYEDLWGHISNCRTCHD